MTTNELPPTLALGDVVLDSYGNPAVVVRITNAGTRFVNHEVMQTCGSDRGRLVSAPSQLVRVTAQWQIDAARDIVRAEAKRRGYKWNAQGITR